MNPFIAVSAVAPSLLLMWYFYKRDVFPEPGKVLWGTFGLGVLTVIPVLIVATPAALGVEQISWPVAKGFTEAFCLAAIPEEFFKLMVVWFFASRHKEFDEPMDGIVYGVAASLGFATLENIMYVASGGGSVAILRAVTAVPNHAFLGAVMGYFVGQARFAPEGQRTRLWVLAYVVPVVLHGLYDFPLLAVSGVKEAGGSVSPLLGLALLLVPGTLIFGWVYSVKQVRRLRKDQVALLEAHGMTVAQAAAGQEIPAGAPAAEASAPAAAPVAAPAAPAEPPAELQARLARARVRHAATARNVAGWSLIWLGGLTASFGGLVGFGVLLAFVLGSSAFGEVVTTAVMGLLLGGVPLVVGAVLFAKGIKRLNQGALART